MYLSRELVCVSGLKSDLLYMTELYKRLSMCVCYATNKVNSQFSFSNTPFVFISNLSPSDLDSWVNLGDILLTQEKSQVMMMMRNMPNTTTTATRIAMY